jgi:hypothetical protein
LVASAIATSILGFCAIMRASPDPSGTIKVECLAKPEFANPSGFVQGGVMAATLDDTLGPAAFAMTGGRRMTTTIDLHVHDLRPVVLALACCDLAPELFAQLLEVAGVSQCPSPHSLPARAHRGLDGEPWAGGGRSACARTAAAAAACSMQHAAENGSSRAANASSPRPPPVPSSMAA